MRFVVCLFLSLILSFYVNARNLDVAVGWSKPPYVIAEGNTGFEIDLFRAVMQSIGHDIVPIYVPFGRSHAMLKSDMVDVTLTMSNRLDVNPERLSDVYITYQNVAISMKKSNLQLDTLADLQNHTVVAFQNASVVLGQEFSQATSKSRLYVELPDQNKQVEMLLLGNTAVVVMDVNIFLHLSKQIRGESQRDNIDIHYLFPPSSYRAGFKDIALKNAFNLALENYMKSDQYQWLKYRYSLQ